MKKEKLFDMIGEIDDEKIISAESKPAKSKSPKVYALAAAACVGLMVGAVYLKQRLDEREKAPSEIISEPYSSHGDSSDADTDIMKGDAQIFFVRDGEIVSVTQELDFDPQEVFSAWKSQNNIGDEVRLISVRIEDNGTDTENSGAAGHTAGDKTVMTVTVSGELKSYLEKDGGELLEQSLQKTMTGYGDPNFTPDEYRLVYDD